MQLPEGFIPGTVSIFHMLKSVFTRLPFGIFPIKQQSHIIRDMIPGFNPDFSLSVFAGRILHFSSVADGKHFMNFI